MEKCRWAPIVILSMFSRLCCENIWPSFFKSCMKKKMISVISIRCQQYRSNSQKNIRRCKFDIIMTIMYIISLNKDLQHCVNIDLINLILEYCEYTYTQTYICLCVCVYYRIIFGLYLYIYWIELYNIVWYVSVFLPLNWLISQYKW